MSDLKIFNKIQDLSFVMIILYQVLFDIFGGWLDVSLEAYIFYRRCTLYHPNIWNKQEHGMSALTDQNYIGNKYPTERKRCATSNYNLYTVNMSDWPYTLEVYQYLHLTPNLRLKLYLSFDPMYLTSAHSVSATGFYFRIRHPAWW